MAKQIKTVNILVSIISIIFIYFLTSCQNTSSINKESKSKKEIDVNGLYNEKLVVTNIFDLDKKYNNLYDQIANMKMVSEYDDGETVEDFDTIFFGRKEQDGIFDNGDEDIEWILLYKDDEKAYLQSKYVIDEIQYININGFNSLPEYLNKKYINEIFDSAEINLLKTIKVEKPVHTKDGNEFDNTYYYDSKNFQTDRKLSLISYDDLIKYYGNVSIEDYRGWYYNDTSDNIETDKIYNNKIKTRETDYVKKLIYNDNKRKQSTYYEYQEEENYNKKNIRIDSHHFSTQGYYYLDSDVIENSASVPEVFTDVFAVSNKGIVEKNFHVFSDYLSPGHNDSTYYLAGLRPIIYIDLKKAKGFKLKNEYRKYNNYEFEKGETFDIDNIECVHKVSDYPEGTHLENIESVIFGSVVDSNDKSKTKPIEWIILDKTNDAYLLMAKYPIAVKRFDEEGRNVDYSDSSIRKWLNEEFYNKSFDEKNKNKIKTIKCDDFEDKVILLGSDDIRKYYGEQIDARKLLSNTFTLSYEKISVGREPFYGKWNDFNQGFLLRDNGEYSYLVKYVDNEGKINETGTLTDMPYMPIRPAIYVSDKSIDIKIDNNSSPQNIINDNERAYLSIDGINNIYIGKCEQDSNLLNGKEDIEWEVIGKEGDDIILISKYILDAEKLSKSHKICKYENSVLRKKLSDLYDEYFGDKEKDLLLERSNINYDSILDGRNGSDVTKEKLFVLSIDDVRKFIGDTNKAYDILKSENTYNLNTRTDIQRLPNDLYLDNNYFLRSIGYVNIGGYDVIKSSFNGKNLDNGGYGCIYWSNVNKNGEVEFKIVNDKYDNTKYYEGIRDSSDIIIDDLYYNGIRPCIKVNINKLKNYLSEKRDINQYIHKEIESGHTYNIDEIDKVKVLKDNEDYITFNNIDTIKFGKYNLEADNSIDLEWFVLYKGTDKALLLSKYLIDNISLDYDEIWEFSDIRKRLNGDFYNNSFNDKEKGKILTTLVEPKSNNQETTRDKVFLPDEKLINEYILDGDINDEKYLQKFNRFKVSKYLEDFVITYNEDHEYGKLDYESFAPYCLNDNNENDEFDPFINTNGQLYYSDSKSTGTRPAIWVKLNDKVIDEYAPIVKVKKYNDDDTTEEKIEKSDDISKYTEEQNVEDFDTVEFGKFFQGEEGKDNTKGKIYYYTMDTMDEYNERFLNNKKESEYSFVELQYDKSMDKKIEWIILDKNDDYALLMSKYILYTINEDGNSFDEWHNNDREFVYAESRTRKWLNEVFYNLAFNEEEKKKICQLSFEDCSQKGTGEIKTFYDNVSILNSVELAKYFGYISKNDVNKKIPTKATGYALGISRNYNSGRTGLKPANDYKKYGFGNSNFIVRSYSITSKTINSEGKIDEEGYTNITGVRPVIKISLGGTNSKNSESTNSKLYYDEELSKTVKVTKTFEESAKLGPMPDTIKFGKYEQDNNLTNGKEDIEWYVLKKEKDKALIISKDILDLQVYDHDRYYGASRFDGSFLYEWLNIKFINDAFNELEIKIIIDTVLYDEKKEYNYTKKESEIIKKYYVTKVFIPLLDELEKFFYDGKKVKAGAYASKYVKGIKNHRGGILVNKENGFSPYWTRSFRDNIADVGLGHAVMIEDSKYEVATNSNNIVVGVRPILWVNIN